MPLKHLFYWILSISIHFNINYSILNEIEEKRPKDQ